MATPIPQSVLERCFSTQSVVRTRPAGLGHSNIILSAAVTQLVAVMHSSATRLVVKIPLLVFRHFLVIPKEFSMLQSEASLWTATKAQTQTRPLVTRRS